MQKPSRAIASIVTSNYLAHALSLYTYIQDHASECHYLVLIIGEQADLPRDLPTGPEWITWDRVLADKDARSNLVNEYTPFELSCILRGRFHHYLSSYRQYEKWIMLDTDVGIFAPLDPIWSALDEHDIALTPHATIPVDIKYAISHEGAFLKSGLFNAGVVGMKRSPTAVQAAEWLSQRLECFGHSYPARLQAGEPKGYDFEFVDQIWVNLMFLYFHRQTVIIDLPGCNLGHWNLHQGEIELRNNQAYFNGHQIVVAHFSGLPKPALLEQVSIYSQIYVERPSPAWAILARDYLNRLAASQARMGEIPYSYAQITETDQHISAPDLPPIRLARESMSGRAPSRNQLRLQKRLQSLLSVKKLIGVMQFLWWKIQHTYHTLPFLWQRAEGYLFQDHSENSFTGLTPCLGNYETYLTRAWILAAVEKAHPHFHGKLLDIGAGSSPYEKLILSNGRVEKYIKLDFADSVYHRGHQLDLTWDGTKIPMEDGSVDTIIMTEVLEHIEHPSALLAEVRRVLKTGGCLFVTVPFTWPMHELPYDYHRFTPIAMKAYLQRSGFSVNYLDILGGWDHALAQQIGLWLSNRSMGDKKRKIAKLFAWPIYIFLIRRGRSEHTAIRNHQMHIGLSCLSVAS